MKAKFILTAISTIILLANLIYAKNVKAQLITLDSPNGNEVIWGNTIQPITWTSINILSSESIIVELSLNNGGNWEYIATVPNTGSYNWEVPHLITDLATVRITQENDFSNRDESDDLFKILGCSLESSFEIATNETQRCANSTITFNSLATNTNGTPLFYKWRINFGAVESTQSNFQKIFSNAGSYIINLEVSNASGCAANFSCPIYIKPQATADFIYDQEDSSYIVNFVASQANANSYNWTANGTSVSAAKIFQYNFGNTGNYEVCLNTNSNCGNSNACKTLTINPTSNCSINSNYIINNQICTNYIASFTSIGTGSATIHEWYVNGVFQTSASILFHTFPTSGEHIVSLVAKNSSGNCSDMFSQIVNVNSSAYDLSKIPDIMNCSINSAIIDARINNVLSYEWRLDGIVKGTNKVLTVFESGNYTITITDQCGQNISEEILVALNDQDCIRPGDFNNDGIVDNNDVVYFGLHYGSKGYERQDQGINWQNYAGLDWGESVHNNPDIDLKHVDPSGNGWIDMVDWLALQKNWLLEHNGSITGASKATVTTYNLNLTPSQQEMFISVPEPEYLLIDINVEADQNNDISLYSSNVNFDLDDYTSQINGQPEFIINKDNSWLTDGGLDIISHSNYDTATKELSIAFTRLDQRDRVGSGRIGQIRIEIINIVSPGVRGQTAFKIEPTEITFFNAQGEQIQLGTSGLKISTTMLTEDLTNTLNENK